MLPRLDRPRLGDTLAGVSVAVVLIPQALAYAHLAGMPPHTGLIVAAAATIAAAPFVSSVWLQSGPVAITAMLTASALLGLAETRSPDYVALAALLALLVGVIRVLTGLFKAGSIAYVMSHPVLAGFLPGAAIVIAASQLPSALGSPSPGTGAVVWDALVTAIDVTSWQPAAVGLTVGTLAIMLGARYIHPLLPGVVIAAAGALVFSHLAGYDGEVIGEVPAVRPSLALGLPWARSVDLLLPAAVIAFVGFAEAATIARLYAAETRTPWSPDREFISQGVANLASGLFGGFPAGGSFSRSAINRLAGAKTAWSGAITGLLVLAFLPFVGLLQALPSAVLSAIVIGAVLGLMQPQALLELRAFSQLQFGIALTTFVLTVVLAPQIHLAVLIGVCLAVIAHLRREQRFSVPHWVQGHELHLRPHGVLYFGSAHVLEGQLIELLNTDRGVRKVVVHLDSIGRMDVTGALQLRTLLEEATTAGLTVVLTDLAPPARKIVHRVFDGRSSVDVHDPDWRG